MPSFRGTDDRRYVLQLTQLPDDPPLEEGVPMRAAFVDAETGERLPGAVDLVDGMPEQIHASFALDRRDHSGGFTSAVLEPVGHGIYEGGITFWDSGIWAIDLQLPSNEGGRITVGGGMVEVGGE